MDLRLLSVPFERLTGVLLVLFLTSIIYAILLQWLERRWGFVSAYTWLTVVIGVGYTLCGLAFLNWKAAALALLVFVVSSVPIIARSIINDMAERNERMDRLEKRGNGDAG